MDVNTIINVVAIILAVGNFICLYSISRKKAYNEEKGKNLATKEDIGNITNEIKSVESKFTILTNLHSGILSEERNTIIEFNEKYSLWVGSYMINWRLNSNNNIDVDEFSRILEKNQELCYISLSKFELFIEDEELNCLAQELIIKAAQLEGLRSIIEEIRPLNILLNSAEAQERKIQEELIKRQVEFLKSYNNQYTSLYREIPAILNVFQQKCRDRIYKLLKPEH